MNDWARAPRRPARFAIVLLVGCRAAEYNF